jgi:Ca2+/Na+ antiporter
MEPLHSLLLLLLLLLYILYIYYYYYIDIDIDIDRDRDRDRDCPQVIRDIVKGVLEVATLGCQMTLEVQGIVPLSFFVIVYGAKLKGGLRRYYRPVARRSS